MSPELAIHRSRRFAEAEVELGPGLRGKVIGAVHDFVRRFDADHRMAAMRYDRLAHMHSGDGELLEIDVTSKHRLLALWRPGVLTLLDVGGKAIVPRYSPTMLATDLRTAAPAAPGMYPRNELIGNLFQNADSRNWQSFAGEDAPDWLYRLTPTQSGIVNGITKRLNRGSIENPNRYFVVGGPGTGKTSVLLSLLIGFTSQGRTVELVVSDELAAFLAVCGIDVARFRRVRSPVASEHHVDVVLVDDPGSQSAIQGALNRGYGASRCIVVAFDPCQLETDMTDEGYARLVRSNGVTPYQLKDCYRQKDVAGRAAKNVIDRIAESSPFLADAKKQWFANAHQAVYEMSNDLRFVNSGGLTHVWESATEKTVRDVADRIKTRKVWGLNAPPILVVADEFTAARDWRWNRAFGTRGHTVVGLHRLQDVKGLEFQWVVFVIRESLYRELQNGFAGATQRVYQARRLLRIPFTRARDGILTMVLPDVARDDMVDAFRWS